MTRSWITYFASYFKSLWKVCQHIVQETDNLTILTFKTRTRYYALQITYASYEKYRLAYAGIIAQHAYKYKYLASRKTCLKYIKSVIIATVTVLLLPVSYFTYQKNELFRWNMFTYSLCTLGIHIFWS